jgi:hypothetical protein
VKFGSNIWRSTLSRNFDVTIGRAMREACNVTWNMATNLVFALGRKKTTENLDRVGRSQDLPDADWLLACSPPINTRALMLIPIWPLLYLKRIFTYLSLHIFLFMRILGGAPKKYSSYLTVNTERLHYNGQPVYAAQGSNRGSLRESHETQKYSVFRTQVVYIVTCRNRK